MSDWLSNLKVGDKVLFYNHYRDPGVVEHVQKVTKLHIVVRGKKHRKTSGSAVGNSWSSGHIHEWTQEREEEIVAEERRRVALRDLRKAIESTAVRDLSLEQIEALLTAYEQAGFVREVEA